MAYNLPYLQATEPGVSMHVLILYLRFSETFVKNFFIFDLDPQCSLEHWGSRENKTHSFPWGQSVKCLLLSRSRLVHATSAHRNISTSGLLLWLCIVVSILEHKYNRAHFSHRQKFRTFEPAQYSRYLSKTRWRHWLVRERMPRWSIGIYTCFPL